MLMIGRFLGFESLNYLQSLAYIGLILLFVIVWVLVVMCIDLSDVGVDGIHPEIT